MTSRWYALVLVAGLAAGCGWLPQLHDDAPKPGPVPPIPAPARPKRPTQLVTPDQVNEINARQKAQALAEELDRDAQADEEHAAGIVFDINTPGGLVDAAFQIRDAILDAKEPTVAFVSRRAYSAGALITLANHTIVMAPGSSIGAAEPRPNEPKYVSALRAEFASTAARTTSSSESFGGESPLVRSSRSNREPRSERDSRGLTSRISSPKILGCGDWSPTAEISTSVMRPSSPSSRHCIARTLP